MRWIIAFAFLSTWAFPVSAEVLTPSQTAIQIIPIISQWAQVIEAQQKQISDLQKENADLKAKYEPSKSPSPDGQKE